MDEFCGNVGEIVGGKLAFSSRSVPEAVGKLVGLRDAEGAEFVEGPEDVVEQLRGGAFIASIIACLKCSLDNPDFNSSKSWPWLEFRLLKIWYVTRGF